MTSDNPSSSPVLTWDAHGLPHSVAFNDKYFCKENGYEETLYVSCEGNQLTGRFSVLDPSQEGVFTIIETGFGTGLNFCCAWKTFSDHAPACWSLHFVSVEKYPLSAQDLSRALDLWPPLKEFKEGLSRQYQPCLNGINQMTFAQGRVRLTIIFEDVIAALDLIATHAIAPQGADAWFLDGFAPSKNPQMWSDEVYQGMARLSRHGTTLATFTVAGFVRRGLEAQGFKVAKHKGYGTKKHILVGTFIGDRSIVL